MRAPGSKTALVRVNDSTWNKLNSLKKSGDTFDMVINRLLVTAEEAKLRIDEK